MFYRLMYGFLLKNDYVFRVILAFPLEEQVVIHHRGGSLSLVRVEAPSIPLVRLDNIYYSLTVAHLNACPFLKTVSPLSRNMI